MNPNMPRDGFHWVSVETYRHSQWPQCTWPKPWNRVWGRDRFRGVEREFGRDRQRDSFPVVQAQTPFDVLVLGAIEGDVDD